jgi:hypothetical protein
MRGREENGVAQTQGRRREQLIRHARGPIGSVRLEKWTKSSAAASIRQPTHAPAQVGSWERAGACMRDVQQGERLGECAQGMQLVRARGLRAAGEELGRGWAAGARGVGECWRARALSQDARLRGWRWAARDMAGGKGVRLGRAGLGGAGHGEGEGLLAALALGWAVGGRA